MTEQLVAKVGDGENVAVIGICTLTSIQNKAYATHLQFAHKLAKDNPDWVFYLYTPYRMTIADFRNSAAKYAQDVNAKYVMFIDDDAVLINNSDIFKKLKDKIDDDENAHIISPVVYVRGYPFNVMFFKELERKEDGSKFLDFYNDYESQELYNEEKSLLRVEAIGCHTCLIKTEVFSGINMPYFKTVENCHTEDVYFCMECKNNIENIGIFVATDITISHLLDPLFVNKDNVEIFREFYERLGYK